MLFFHAPPRSEREELIDSQEPSEADFAASFADVARVNRYLGGTAAVLNALPPLLAHVPTGRPVRVLDIATGSADIPRALARAFRRGRYGAGRAVEIVALDNHPKVLAYARRETPPDQYPEIRVVEGDAFALDYPDRAFDVAVSSLAFHHFGPGLIVNDLLRDSLACGLIWAVTRLVGAHRLTRHDAPLSVLRAYTRAEYRQMAREAGLSHCTARIVPMYRVVLVAHSPPSEEGSV
jgi:SAM-dependent methyltransferase